MAELQKNPKPNEFSTLEELGRYCAKMSTRIRHLKNNEIKRIAPIIIPHRKRLNIKHILIGLGEHPEIAMSNPSQYGYPGFKDKAGRGFSWKDHSGSEVAQWINYLYKKQVSRRPCEKRLKELNVLRDAGFKICRFH